LIRSFLAIELPATVQTKIGKIEEDLGSTSADVRWVSPGKIHLTLKFFGNIEESKIDSIITAIKGPINSAKPFHLSVRGTGAFPSLKNPRVIWIGLVDAGGILAALQKEVESSLEKIGFEPEDRSFRPHLTLGRVKSNRGKEELVKSVEKYREEEIGTFQVEKTVLFKSDLTPTGPVYTRLREVNLGEE
jgi:RNA 2',3'-cyclic 3'-phosphodiesterase